MSTPQIACNSMTVTTTIIVLVAIIVPLATALATVLWWVFTKQQKVLDTKASQTDVDAKANGMQFTQWKEAVERELCKGQKQFTELMKQNQKNTKETTTLKTKMESVDTRLEKIEVKLDSYFSYVKRRDNNETVC